MSDELSAVRRDAAAKARAAKNAHSAASTSLSLQSEVDLSSIVRLLDPASYVPRTSQFGTKKTFLAKKAKTRSLVPPPETPEMTLTLKLTLLQLAVFGFFLLFFVLNGGVALSLLTLGLVAAGRFLVCLLLPPDTRNEVWNKFCATEVAPGLLLWHACGGGLVIFLVFGERLLFWGVLGTVVGFAYQKQKES